MKRYDQLLQVVRECDYRVLEAPGCGCQAAQARCLMARGGSRWDRHEVNPHDCLECTKKDEVSGGEQDGRFVDEDSKTAKGDDGVKDLGDEPPVAHRGHGAERIGAVVLESGLEREVLRLERELFLLQDDLRRLTIARFPAVEQQLAALWYNPNSCTNPTFVLSASPASPQNFGTNITFTMTNSDSPLATGTVQFLDGLTNIGTLQTLSSGIASISTSSLSAATHTINANYSGDGNYCFEVKSISYQIQSAFNPCSGGFTAGTYHFVDPFFGVSKAFGANASGVGANSIGYPGVWPAYGPCPGTTTGYSLYYLTQCPGPVLKMQYCGDPVTNCITSGTGNPNPGAGGCTGGTNVLGVTCSLVSSTSTSMTFVIPSGLATSNPWHLFEGSTITIS